MTPPIDVVIDVYLPKMLCGLGFVQTESHWARQDAPAFPRWRLAGAMKKANWGLAQAPAQANWKLD